MARILKMTEMRTLGRNRLTFITTDNCTAACPHCLMNCKPGLTHALTFLQMKEAIDSFRAKEMLRLVVFTGGEPTLLGEELLETIRYCRSHGILTRVVSNAHWASTPEKAEAMLSALREAGLDELNMSMDDFHAPYVPIENIRTAWKALKGKGFLSGVIANCHGEGDTITPEYIQEFFGERITVRDSDHRSLPHPDEKRAEDGTLYIIAEGRLQKLGRADETICTESKYYQQEKAIYGGCSAVLCEPCVSYSGHVWACCGVCCEGNPVLDIGNLGEDSFDKIVEQSTDSVLLSALYYIGPARLWDMVCTLDPSLNTGKKFHTICEICEELTTNETALANLRHNLPALVMAIRQIKAALKETKNEESTADTDAKA